MRHLPDLGELTGEPLWHLSRELLRRFRFHGVPGAPVAAGVPVDRGAQFEAELAPVFSALEDAQHHAEDLVAAATREAARLRADAAERGHRLVTDARAHASGARSDAAQAVLTRADGERMALLAAARTEVDRIDLVAAERTPTVVEHVVRWVLTLGDPLP